MPLPLSFGVIVPLASVVSSSCSLSWLAPAFPPASNCSQWKGWVLGAGCLHCPLVPLLIMPLPVFVMVAVVIIVSVLPHPSLGWCCCSHLLVPLAVVPLSPLLIIVVRCRAPMIHPASRGSQRYCGCWVSIVILSSPLSAVLVRN